MAALLKLPYFDVPHAQVSHQTRAFINRLRFHASLCRASAHLDIFTACAVIDPDGGEQAAATTLLRVLGQALDKPPLWHRPGEPTFSFDEMWLAEVLEACARGDDDSFMFLTMRRVSRDKQRIFGMLARNLTNTLF